MSRSHSSRYAVKSDPAIIADSYCSRIRASGIPFSSEALGVVDGVVEEGGVGTVSRDSGDSGDVVAGSAGAAVVAVSTTDVVAPLREGSVVGAAASCDPQAATDRATALRAITHVLIVHTSTPSVASVRSDNKRRRTPNTPIADCRRTAWRAQLAVVAVLPALPVVRRCLTAGRASEEGFGERHASRLSREHLGRDGSGERGGASLVPSFGHTGDSAPFGVRANR